MPWYSRTTRGPRPPSLQALRSLLVEFRKEETRFLNKVEAQKGIKPGGTLGIVESDSQVRLAAPSSVTLEGG